MAQYSKVIALAKETGQLQRDYFKKKDLKIETKSSHVDFVTEVDLLCDKKIVAGIRAMFKEDHILSEEQGVLEGSSAYQWIIDPLDGTTNFSIGHPIFAVSIARWYQDEPVFGVVYIPMLDMCYTAEKGKGAFLNGMRIEGSKKASLGESVIATGFPYDRATAKNNNGDNIKRMVPLVKGIRRMGAAAYDLCLVAEGVYDAFWELRLGKWDLAAGKLIIEEAGGTFNMTESDGKYNCIAGSRDLCEQIGHLLNMSNV